MDRLPLRFPLRPLSGTARGQAAQRAQNHLGTLGTGNHFVEVCLDENDAVWIMLHSGSRGIGNKIGGYFIERAKHEMKRWFIDLPDEDPSWPLNTINADARGNKCLNLFLQYLPVSAGILI